jgi:hypothetical protein
VMGGLAVLALRPATRAAGVAPTSAPATLPA